MTTSLSVNVNKIAWLRNARNGKEPSVTDCCRTIVAAGAQGITVHPRSDQRHIRPDDVIDVAKLVRELGVEYNIEGNPNTSQLANGYPGFLKLVEQTVPTQCTLVPDSDDQLTSDHGWDLSSHTTLTKVTAYVESIHQMGSRVSLFLDPEIPMVERARDSGADRIELYTGPWCKLVATHGLDSQLAQNCLERFAKAAIHARKLGLEVNAGHDLNLSNVGYFCAATQVAEVSIGQALISDSLIHGLKSTVILYLGAIQSAS